MKPASELVDQLGVLLHEEYVACQHKLGETSESNPCLVPFSSLPMHLQKSNRESASQCWQLLEAVGLEILPLTDSGIALPAADYQQHLELLSELAHCRWINNRLQQGWSYAEEGKDPVQRTSPCLIAWDALPKAEQNKVRAQYSALPDLLRSLGYKIVRQKVLSPGWRFREEPLDSLPLIPAAPPLSEIVDGQITQPSSQLLEAIARELHVQYISHRRAEGDSEETSPSMVPWEDLDPRLQQFNLSTPRQIWSRLAGIGYGIALDGASFPVVSPDEFAQHVEVLARLEHTAWMNERLAADWSYAPGEKNLANKTHPCLVEWDALPVEEQEKDRQQVRAMPSILASAGLRLILLPSTTPLRPDYIPSLE